MVDYKSLCHLTILLLSLCLMLVHCALEPADQFLDNPTDDKQVDSLSMHKRPSFFVGSRYGRSSPSGGNGAAYAPSKTRRLNVVPRNDRFFLGSRYGKRAEISTGTQLSNKPTNDDMFMDTTNGWDSAANSNGGPAGFYMSCVYTGLQNFYRCNSIDAKFYVAHTAPFNENVADIYNDDNVNGYGSNDDDKHEADDANDGAEGPRLNGDAVSEVLSTDATGSGGRINDGVDVNVAAATDDDDDDGDDDDGEDVAATK